MFEQMVEIHHRGRTGGSSAELLSDAENLEISALNVLSDIARARSILCLELGGTCERATLLNVADAAVGHSRAVLIAMRAAPTERGLAEARTWLSQAREALAKVPGLPSKVV
jgi:hypothetical protein